MAQPTPSRHDAGGAGLAPLNKGEYLLQLQQRRPEDDHEHRREDEQHGREEHLDRRLGGLFLGRGLALEAAVRGLHAQDTAERDAELVGLDERAHEGGDLARIQALSELLERLGTARADAHLAQHQLELLDQRPMHVLGQLADRRVEREPGLNRNGQQIERVGKLRDGAPRGADGRGR